MAHRLHAPIAKRLVKVGVLTLQLILVPRHSAQERGVVKQTREGDVLLASLLTHTAATPVR